MGRLMVTAGCSVVEETALQRTGCKEEFSMFVVFVCP